MKLTIAIILIFVIGCYGCDNRDKSNAVATANPADAGVKLTPEQIQALLSEAIEELNKKNFGRTTELTVRVTRSDPTNTESYVIEAQAKSMSGDVKAALEALDLALRNGLKDIDRIMREQRLDAVRATPAFPDLLRKYGLSLPASAGETEIRAGNVSIKENSVEKVIRAGDLTIRVPKD